MSKRITVIVSLPRGEDPASRRLVDAIEKQLAHIPTVDVAVLAHLYDLAPDGPGVQLLRLMQGDLVVMSWLYPRAAFWTLDAHGITGRSGERVAQRPPAVAPSGPGPEASRTIWCIDLRTADDPAAFIRQVERIVASHSEMGTVPICASAKMGLSPSAPRATSETPAPRWYPVIDFARCSNCLECLNFCLFGVYSLDRQDRITVEQPGACRNGCPACSRICPEGAIMFPQHKDPAISGDPAAAVSDLKLDLSQLFRGSSVEELAQAERRHYLAEKQREEAVRSKPAPDAIDRLLDDVERLDL